VILLCLFLIAACSSNSDEPDENGGNNGNGNGDNGNGDGGDENNELEGYYLWDWESFDYVFGSLYDVHENNYRLPFKNVDANPDDYEYGQYVDSLIYPAVIFDGITGVNVPLDTNAYMVIYMVADKGGYNLTTEHKYGNGDFFYKYSLFYSDYKPKGVNFLYKREDMKDQCIRIVSGISDYTQGYFNIETAMSLCTSINRYHIISSSAHSNRYYFLEKPRKAN